MISVIVDSASDITREEASLIGLKVLPLTVRFGEEEYYDGVTIDSEQFYTKLVTTDIFPKTSQLTPYGYEEAFREELEKGNDILCLTITSKLSGCYQSANIAKEVLKDDYPNAKIAIFDTATASIAEGLLAKEALKLSKEFSLEEVVSKLNELRDLVKVIALIDTLEYLKKGGRISSTVATLGGILSIKPVLTVNDGLIEVIGKAKGSRKANNLLNQFVEKFGGINFNYPIALAYSGFDRKVLDIYLNDSKDLYQEMDINDFDVYRLGAVIGSYAGPNGIVLAFFANNK